MIEDHGRRTEHEKKPNENYGRDKTVVWWVELVILHMVLLNDVQTIVVVPQIQYIAVCDATTSSPKLQMCSETVDICNKSIEWSMFLSWCRGSFPPCKKNFLLLSILSFLLSSRLEKSTLFFEKIVEHFFLVFVDKCFLRVPSVVDVSAVDLQLFVEILINRNKFPQKSFLMFFYFWVKKKLDVHLLRNFFSSCFSSFYVIFPG